MKLYLIDYVKAFDKSLEIVGKKIPETKQMFFLQNRFVNSISDNVSKDASFREKRETNRAVIETAENSRTYIMGKDGLENLSLIVHTDVKKNGITSFQASHEIMPENVFKL